MEILVFALVMFGLAVYGVWRVRRGGSVDDPDRARQGLPDDLRMKEYGLYGLPNRGRPTKGGY